MTNRVSHRPGASVRVATGTGQPLPPAEVVDASGTGVTALVRRSTIALRRIETDDADETTWLAEATADVA